MEPPPIQVLSDAVDGTPPRKTFRRSYKKSTAGCTTCKTRKIKCDEVRPACGNCKRRYVNAGHCQYDPRSRRAALSAPRKPATPCPPLDGQEASLHQTIPWRPLGLSDAEERVLELRLMYEYTKATCDVRSFGAIFPLFGYSIWEVDIPQVAFSSDIVLNAVLGLSALHLQGTNPDDPVLSRASLLYFDRAVTKHQAALDQVDEHTIEPLLLAAFLIAHHTWLSANCKSPHGRFVINIQTYHMCNGIAALMQKFEARLHKYLPPKLEFTSSNEDNRRFILNTTQDLDLLSLAFNKLSISPERKALYESAVNELVVVHMVIASDAGTVAIEKSILTYLWRLPLAFANLLKAEDPISMALYARVLCMLTLAEDSPAWWIHGAGEHKVALKSVLGIQKLMPPPWNWTMDWPVKVVLKEIDLYSDYKDLEESSNLVSRHHDSFRTSTAYGTWSMQPLD